MSHFISHTFLVPAWFITIGILALSTPPPTIGMAAFLFIAGAVILPFAIFAIGLKRPVVALLSHARPSSPDACRAQVAAIAEGDARDLLAWTTTRDESLHSTAEEGQHEPSGG